jgi:cytidylate kinase
LKPSSSDENLLLLIVTINICEISVSRCLGGSMENVMKRLTIAIDGPAGAGKSTVAKAVAAALGYTYLDTGAMYRAAAWKGLQAGVPLEDEEGTIRLVEKMRIAFAPGPDGGQRVMVDGEDVTEAIRSPEVTRLSSPVSAIPGVRRVLVAQQQAMGAGGGVVMEGRDIGTVVFPDAEVKVFLTASDEERARRRCAELQAKGQTATVEEILKQQRERDARDSSRADSPLKPAPDAITIVSDGIPVEGVVERILQLCRVARFGRRAGAASRPCSRGGGDP